MTKQELNKKLSSMSKLTKKDLKKLVTKEDVLQVIDFCEEHSQYYKRMMVLAMFKYLTKR